MATLSRQFRKLWSAAEIIDRLEKLNPAFFPFDEARRRNVAAKG
jgi:hypothetical protein